MQEPLHGKTLQPVVDQRRNLWLIDIEQSCGGGLGKLTLFNNPVDRDGQANSGLLFIRSAQAKIRKYIPRTRNYNLTVFSVCHIAPRNPRLPPSASAKLSPHLFAPSLCLLGISFGRHAARTRRSQTSRYTRPGRCRLGDPPRFLELPGLLPSTASPWDASLQTGRRLKRFQFRLELLQGISEDHSLPNRSKTTAFRQEQSLIALFQLSHF